MLGAMSLSLIVGPPNSGRAGEIRARLEAALDRDPVLVVPTLDDADRFERELCRAAMRAPSSGPRSAPFAPSPTRSPRRPGPAPSPALRRAAPGARPRGGPADAASGAQRLGGADAGSRPALERLIGELQAALIGPGELASAAAELEDGAYESELAAPLRGLRRAARRRRARRCPFRPPRGRGRLRERPEAWGARPVLLYGFDDLTEEQLELVAALARRLRGHGRGQLRGPRGAGAAGRAAGAAARRARAARTRAASPSTTGYTRERHPAPPRPAPVRGRREPRRARRRDRDARVRRRARRGRGDRRRDRPAARRRRPGRRHRRGPAASRAPRAAVTRGCSRASGSRSRSRRRCRWLEPPPAAALAALARASLPDGGGRGPARVHARPPGRAAGDRRLARAPPAARRGAARRTS